MRPSLVSRTGMAWLLLTWSLMTCPGAQAAGAGAAAASGDPLLDALVNWATRAKEELRLKDAPAPARTVMAAFDGEVYRLTASFGALIREDGMRLRPGRVEVVVGDDRLDSSRFKGRLPASVTKPNLVVDDARLALERDLWIASDRSYKNAVQRWQIKKSAREALGGEPPPPDWSPAPVEVAVSKTKARPLDRDGLKALALAASGRLREVQGLRTGEVRISALDGRYLLATSEGTRIAQPGGYVGVVAWADVLREDGVRVMGHRTWVARTSADLPKRAQVEREVLAMGRDVIRRSKGEKVEYYEGPVLFEGPAAADFFRHLIPPEVRGTPPAPSAQQTYQQQIRSGPRLGRRLLPPGWSVVDDPTRRLPGLAGGYRYDREGVRAKEVRLVRDGYVRDLLMGRVPRHDLQKSNGHARGLVQGGAFEAEMSLWTVSPPRALVRKAIRRKARRAMKAAGLDRVLVVRRLQPSSRRSGGLPRPTEAVWWLANGKEVPVLEVAFQKVDRRTLRDIAAAGGKKQVRPYLIGRQASSGAGVPAVVTAPSLVLVEGMEVVFTGADEQPHTYDMPPL